MDASTPQERRWPEPRSAPNDLTPDEMEEWRRASAGARVLGERHGLSMAEAARRADVRESTFSSWYHGSYAGSIPTATRKVLRWVESVEEQAHLSATAAVPGYVPTRTASEIIETLIIAQRAPAMVTIVLGPGMGKTYTTRHYAATHPHVTIMTMTPTTGDARTMLRVLGRAVGVWEHRRVEADAAIGDKLRRNGRETLLIVDEAQYLDDQAVDQLRYYLDTVRVGIALVGNEEFAGRYMGSARDADGRLKPAFAQVHRRITKRLHRARPLREDIDAYVAAWRVDPQVAELMRAIGRRQGALGQITETMVLAHMLAAGEGVPLAAHHLEAAWANRGDDYQRQAALRAAPPAAAA